MRFKLHHSTGDPEGPAKISCCCFHPVRPRIYVAVENRVIEYDLVTGRELGSREENAPVTDLHCSNLLTSVVALVNDHAVRVYKELALNGGNCLRPTTTHLCTRQGRDEERVKCCALSQNVQRDGSCSFYFGKVGRANVYAMTLFAGQSVGEVTKVAGCKKALRTEPHEIVCHPTKPIFVAVSDSAAVVGNDLGFMLFELDTGSPHAYERLHSLSFHPTLPRMLGICGRDLLCWDVSGTKAFTLVGRVQTDRPTQGVYFLPGLCPYFFSLVLKPAASARVESWFVDDSQQQPLQKSVALDTSVLTKLAVKCLSRNRCSLFSHATLPVVVVVGRSSFSVVHCTDHQFPMATTPTYTPLHLSIGMITMPETPNIPTAHFFPSTLYFMQQNKVWAYSVAAASCKEAHAQSLPATATAVVKMEAFVGQDESSPVFLVNAQMEFGGGTRAAFLLCSGRDSRRRNCRDASLLSTACWDSSVAAARSESVGAVAACISEDGLQLSFEGSETALAQHDLSAWTGPHALGCAVNRVFVTPFGDGKALLYVDTKNVVRFSKNVATNSESSAGQWSVWKDGPSLRLHGDESVIQAVWQSGEETDLRWQPVLALVTSRRAMLLSVDLEVLAHAEGRSDPLGIPSGVWCGVVFLHTSPVQVRWLAVDGSNGALVSLPAPNAMLFGVTSDRVLLLIPDGHSSYVHAIPVALLEPLAVGWIASTLAMRTSATVAVQQVNALIKAYSGSQMCSSGLLAAIVALVDELQSSTGDADRIAKEQISAVGLSLAFSSSGSQFPLQLRLEIALYCGAHQLAFDALLEEWAMHRSGNACTQLLVHSPLGRLFDRLGSACSRCGEHSLSQSCHGMLYDGWQIRASWGQSNPSDGPKTFLDVLTRHADLLPATVPPTTQATASRLVASTFDSSTSVSSDTEQAYGFGPVRCGVDSPVQIKALGNSRKSWGTMVGIQSHAQSTGGDAWGPQGNDGSGGFDRGASLSPSRTADPVPTTSGAVTDSENSQRVQHTTAGLESEDGSEDELEAEPTAGLASAGWSLDRFTDSSDEDDVGQMPKRISISIKPRENVALGGVGGVGRSVSDVLTGLDQSPAAIMPPKRTMSLVPPPVKTTISRPK